MLLSIGDSVVWVFPLWEKNILRYLRRATSVPVKPNLYLMHSWRRKIIVFQWNSLE